MGRIHGIIVQDLIKIYKSGESETKNKGCPVHLVNSQVDNYPWGDGRISPDSKL